MAYYADQVTDLIIDTSARFTVVRAKTAKDCVQCYLSGVLVAHQMTDDGAVEFALPILGIMDIVFLLAVDTENAETNYFTDAFPTAATYGNRINIKVPTHSQYLADDRLRVYVGDDGVAVGALDSDDIVDERDIFPGGQYCGGWGGRWGQAWGIGDYGPGWGHNWGRGEWGFDCIMLEHITAPLPPGAYPVKITVLDTVDNESSGDTDTVTLATFPRPASNLAVQSYDKATDTLVLSFTESDDL
ncbi:MAG: hypothetical protein KAV00_06835 [Phycisphaerae bacterium]|nr:hypothetical protein [Phycisphaerae bacterium]